jgi:hypothetical protein
MKTIFLALILGFFATSHADPSVDLSFETSAFMKQTVDNRPESLANDSAPSGAYGPFNRKFDMEKKGEWYIESQRFGVDAITAGLAWNRQDLIDKGLHILDWGFARENADGSFSCPDNFHSTAFFVEAAARTAILLESSQFKIKYASWILKAKENLLLSARWMASPQVLSRGMRGDQIYTHRYYLNADALAFAGLLNNDDQLLVQAKKLIAEGVARQDPAGFNPEKGGFDTSYHAVGMVFALRYFAIVADPATRGEMKPMISRALLWLKGRVQADGSFDQKGNTRTGDGQEIGRDQKPKTMSWGSATRAFAEWAMLSDETSYWQLAKRVFAYGSAHPHN